MEAGRAAFVLLVRAAVAGTGAGLSSLARPLCHQRAPFTWAGPGQPRLVLCLLPGAQRGAEEGRGALPRPSAELTALVDVQPAEQE